MLQLYRTAPEITTLGPGTRFVVWTQGCIRSCPGCMSTDSRPLDGGYFIEEEELADYILRFDFEGLTISGGEPFIQCAALVRLIRLVRDKRETGIILYTGYTIEELTEMHDADVDALLASVDLLIDGPYIEKLDDGGGWRGSSNQRAILLTERYREAVQKEFGVKGTRRQQIHIDPRGALLVGLRNNDIQYTATDEDGEEEVQ